MSIANKAIGLVDAGKVRNLLGATAYVIDAENDNYLVLLAGYRAICTCPAPGNCSHVEAARIYNREQATA